MNPSIPVLLAAFALSVSVMTGCTAETSSIEMGSSTSDDNGDVGCAGEDNAWTFNLVTLDPPVACVQLKDQPGVTCGPMTSSSMDDEAILSTATGGVTFDYTPNTHELTVNGPDLSAQVRCPANGS
jgi:hypothetical protein